MAPCRRAGAVTVARCGTTCGGVRCRGAMPSCRSGHGCPVWHDVWRGALPWRLAVVQERSRLPGVARRSTAVLGAGGDIHRRSSALLSIWDTVAQWHRQSRTRRIVRVRQGSVATACSDAPGRAPGARLGERGRSGVVRWRVPTPARTAVWCTEASCAPPGFLVMRSAARFGVDAGQCWVGTRSLSVRPSWTRCGLRITGGRGTAPRPGRPRRHGRCGSQGPARSSMARPRSCWRA